VMEEGW
jgi:cupin superfamily acireductone dioxygenase involved in methionine salvage